MTQTTYGAIGQRTAAWAATEMLSHAEPMKVLCKYGQSKPLPKNTANVAKFRRPVPFTVSTVPAQEGVTPTPRVMQYEDVQATMQQYIGVTEITDKVTNLSEDPVLSDATELSGEEAGETVEMVTYNAVKAGTSVSYANGSARTDVNTVITVAKQRAVTRLLKANRAKKISQRLSGSQNYATFPVDAAFFAFGHTDIESDLRNLSGFTPVESYGSMKSEPYEVGKLEDVRYILAPHFDSWADGGGTAGSMKSTTGASADVYPVLYLGKEAFGCVPLKGAGAIKPMVLNPETPSKSDPAGQKGFVSWKAWYTALILNQTWLSRLEIAVTDL